MQVEWKDYDNRSFLQCGPGEVSVARDPATDKWCAFAFDQPILDAENREAAKAAAETEARRVLMQGLRELGWPDDAAVERASARYYRGLWDETAPSAALTRKGMRAALTAAMGGE